MIYSGLTSVPGAPGNLMAGGPLLRDLFPNAPADAPQLQKKFGKPNIPLNQLFPPRPGGLGIPQGMPGYEFDRHLQKYPRGFSSVPVEGQTTEFAGGPSFEIPRAPGALGGRSGEQLKRLYEGGTQQNKQLNEELMRRGIMPGSGPQLPMVYGAPGNAAGLANAGFFGGPQMGQLPVGFGGKTVYS